jgi:molybdate transport system substrate-binding protein
MKSRATLLVAVVATVLSACSGVQAGASVGPSATAPAVGLTVYAAASLKGALDAARGAYESSHPGVTLSISTDSSSALETKIEQGAPADVFLSADTSNPAELVDANLTVGPAIDFAGNKLTIIVPSSDPAGIASPADLAKPGVKVVAAGDAVPITRYANEVVANLAREPGYPPDYQAAYRKNIVSREDNVKAVVAKLELGEGDAALVYETDARASTEVRTVDIPPAANVVATYAGVVVTSAANPTAARAFLTWLAGPDGQAILGGLGFLPPRS